MIPCEHKHQYPATNRGVIIELCTLKGKLVNTNICQKCIDHNGTFEQLHPTVEVDFIRRSDAEIQSIRNCCSSCPLFNEKLQTCKKVLGETIPTDILAQNPANHCQEGRW